MSSLASQRLPRLQLRLLGRRRSHMFDVSPLMLLSLLGWTSLLVPIIGIKGARFGGPAYILFTLLWIAVIVVRFLRHREIDTNLEFATIWTTTISLAYLATSLGGANPAILFAPLVIALSAVICRRYTVQSIFVLALLSGSYGTAAATFKVGVGPLIHLILAGLWAGIIWRVVTKRRTRALRAWPAMILVGVYMAVTLLEITTAESFYIGIRSISVSQWYMLVFLVVAYTSLTSAELLKLGRLFVAVATAVGGYATMRHFTGPSAAESAYAFATGGNYNTLDGHTLSLFGSFGGRHDLAVWTSCAVPLCIGCALGWRDRWRYIAMLGAAFCVFDLIDTDVRAAIPAVLAGIVVTFALYALTPAFGRQRLGVAVISVSAVAAVGVALFLALGVNSNGHYTGLLHPTQDSSFSERTYKWSGAIRDITHHPAGMGLGSAGRVHIQYGRFFLTSNETIENSYLVIAYQEGFIVMSLFVLMLLAVLGTLAARTITTRSQAKATLAIGPVGALVSFMVMMMNGPYVEGIPALWIWLILGLGVAQFAFRDPDSDPVPTDAEGPDAQRVLPEAAPPRVPAHV